jgi:hypothetical protein
MAINLLPWVLRGGDFSKPGWHTQPTAAYQLMFEFLRVSPSYELARKARTTGLSKEEKKILPEDFEQVLKTYDLIGDVNCVLFRLWWLKRGLGVFGNPYSKPDIHEIAVLPAGSDMEVKQILSSLQSDFSDKRRDEGLTASVLVSLPLDLKTTEILRKVRKLLNAYKGKDVGAPTPPKIILMGKRFHANPMFKGLRLLWIRAAKPNWELWRLGAKAQLSDSYSKELDPAAPRKAKDTIEIDDRITMGKITFRALHRFEHIAENAARGRFPCSDPVALSEFNYPEIAQRLLKHTKWVKSKKLKWVENSKTAK